MLAYSNQSLTALQLLETTEARQQHLFSHYIDRMFQHRGATAPYSREQTQHWLQWLASQMQQRGQSVFYIERMQPDWLPVKRAEVFASVSLLFFVIGGGLSGWSLGRFVSGWPISGLLIGLFIGLVVGAKNSIELPEKITFSRSEARGSFFEGTTIYVSILWGLICGVGAWWTNGPRFGLAFGMLGWLSGQLGISIRGGLLYEVIDQKISPNQGVHFSARNALALGLAAGLLNALFFRILNLILL